MKKFFIAICFNIFCVISAFASITPLNQYSGSLQPSSSQQNKSIQVVDYDEFVDMVKESFMKAHIATKEELQKQSFATIPSLESQKRQENNNKNIFEKIYDNAMKRAEQDTVYRADVAYQNQPDINRTLMQQQWNQNNFPTLTINMPPFGTPTQVAAMEHIPYYASNLEVLDDGVVKITETIVVIANGEKLREGLTKILPAKIHNGKNGLQTLDYTVIGVLRNNQYVDYHLTMSGGKVLLIPDEKEPLAPGVYTYQFEYLVDNLLVDKGNSYMIYWDAGGHGWNLIVNRISASITLPKPAGLIQHNALFGTDDNLRRGAVLVAANGPSGVIYQARQPLFIGEGMYLLAVIDKSVLLPVSLWQKFMRKFYGYNDIILATIGALFIGISLFISWLYIKNQKKIQKVHLNKTAMILRYLYNGKFDIKAVCGFLLEIYKKNLIDIQQSDDTILLIKRTDNLSSLSKQEQYALSKLFPSHETIFNVGKNTKLMFNRFAGQLHKCLNKQMSKFRFKLNIGYVAISMAMLLFTEAFIAYFNINIGITFAVLSITSLICIGLIMLWNVNVPLWAKAIIRLIIIGAYMAGWIAMSLVITPKAAGILMIAEVMIAVAINFYDGRRGLLRYYIDDINTYRDSLKKNTDSITLGKNWLNHQANIWVLDLAEEIKPIKEEEYYKIPVIENLVNVMKK